MVSVLLRFIFFVDYNLDLVLLVTFQYAGNVFVESVWEAFWKVGQYNACGGHPSGQKLLIVRN